VLIKAVECGECKNIVYSRTDRDVRECSCGRVIVSGGLQYFNYDIAPETSYEVKKVKVEANPNILHEDWRSLRDKFGLICESVKKEQEHFEGTYIV
jgi:hypothetical protein